MTALYSLAVGCVLSLLILGAAVLLTDRLLDAVHRWREGRCDDASVRAFQTARAVIARETRRA